MGSHAPAFKIQYLRHLFGILLDLSLSHLLTHSVIYLCQYALMDIYTFLFWLCILKYNSIVLYLVAQIVLALARVFLILFFLS